MISVEMQKAINEQINKELYSSYLYLSMSASASALGFKGAAKWFKVQSVEENGHAMKFYDYLVEQNAPVKLQAIKQPTSDFKGLPELFEGTHKHEQFVTQSIYELMALAKAEKDYASELLLQWFVKEQIEEEAHALEIVGQLKMAGSSAGTQLMLDHQLGKRGG